MFCFCVLGRSVTSPSFEGVGLCRRCPVGPSSVNFSHSSPCIGSVNSSLVAGSGLADSLVYRTVSTWLSVRLGYDHCRHAGEWGWPLTHLAKHSGCDCCRHSGVLGWLPT